MGLVEHALVSKEPPHWGWLLPLAIENIDAALAATTGQGTEGANPGVLLTQIQGALAFTSLPSLSRAFDDLFPNPSEPVIEHLLLFREHLKASGGRLPMDVADAVASLLREECLMAGGVLDAVAAAPATAAEALPPVSALLQDREHTLVFLGLSDAIPQLREARACLDTFLAAPSTDPTVTRERLLDAVVPLAQLEHQIEDAIFLGVPPREGLGPSAIRKILGTLAPVLQEEISSLRHLLLEAPQQGDRHHLAPGLDKIIGAFHMLEQVAAARHLERTVDRLETLDTEQIAGDLAQADMLVLGLTTHLPHDFHWEAGPERSEGSKPTRSTAAWEEFGLLLERWARAPQPEHTLDLRRLLRTLDVQDAPSQALLARMSGMLESCFTSLSPPEKLSQAAMLQAFRALRLARFSDQSDPDALAAADAKLAAAEKEQKAPSRMARLAAPAPLPENGPKASPGADDATVAPLSSSPPPNPPAPESPPESVPAAPASLLAPRPHGLQPPSMFQWEAELPESLRDSFWGFVLSNWGVLARPEHPNFWLAMGWIQASMAMLTWADHPITAPFARAIEARRLQESTVDVLEWMARQVDTLQRESLPKMLGILELQAEAARQALADQDLARAQRLLTDQARLLAEHGFVTEESE